MPPIDVAETTGTIWSPCPPSTIAVTSLAEVPVSQAMKVLNRAVSRIPAMPKTRSRGHPETCFATWHMASSGLETTIRIASRRALDRLAGHGADDLLVRRHEVVSAHARLARQPRGDHDHVGAGGLLVVVRTGDRRLVAEHRGCLAEVERLSLREAFLDVDEDHVRVVAPRDLLGGGGAHIARSDHRHLPSQTRTPILSMTASATSLVPTAVGSSRFGFMSYVTDVPSATTAAIAALEPVGGGALLQMAEHHHAGQHHRHRVHPVLAGVLRRGAVGRLEDGRVRAEVAAGSEAQASDQPGAEVGDDVAVEVRTDEDVVLLRPLHELHRHVVDDLVLELDVLVLGGDLARHCEVEPVSELHDVGLVDGRDLAATGPTRVVEGKLDDPPRAVHGDRLHAEAGVR